MDLALGVCVAMGAVADSGEVDCVVAFGVAGVFCVFLGVFL